MTIFRKNIITLGFAALGIFITMIIVAPFLMDYQYNITRSNALFDTAQMLMTAVGEDRIREYCISEQATDDTLFNDLETIRNAGIYRLSLINANGDILWDSAFTGGVVNHRDRSEVQAALRGEQSTARRYSMSTGTRQLYVALPVYASGDLVGDLVGGLADGSVAGIFRLSITIPGFWQRISPVWFTFLGCALIVLVAVLIAVTVFSHSLAQSLKRLTTIAEMAAGEDFLLDKASSIAVSGEAHELITLEAALQHIVKELKRRMEQAQAEDRQFLAILNGMSEAVLAMDANLTLYLVNSRARSLFGLSDAHGSSLLEVTRSTELEKAARKALAKGNSLEMKLKLTTGNREARTEQLFQVFITPLSAQSLSSPAGVIMVMEDITRLARLEQMRKDFVANVSHELRTPIQLIKGYSETFADTPIADEEHFRRGIEIIHKNARTMENLTNDLLVLANLEENTNSASRMEEQLLAPLFTEAVLSVEPVAKARRTQIEVNCPADLKATVHGSFIIQALINFLDNGIKYSPRKSHVWASAYRENENIVLEVRDEGIGIPGEHLERIFERFYRVDRAHSRETGGTGLGLSIVRHIALLHQGTVEVQSHAGEGSIFRIRIPA